MGKPLRVSVSVSLRALNTESRVSTRSAAHRPLKYCNVRYFSRFQKGKCNDLKSLCLLAKPMPTRRVPMMGKTNLPITTYHLRPAAHQNGEVGLEEQPVKKEIQPQIKKEQQSQAKKELQQQIKKEPAPSSSQNQHQSSPSSSSKAQEQRSPLELPTFRVVGRMEPLRAMPRHNDERCDDETYLKRHEKYERQEKSIKRRDRQWQREEQYRLRLMKMSKEDRPTTPKLHVIQVTSSSKKPKTRRH